MSLQELAGMFADDSEKPYAKYDKPEPEKKEYATGGLLDLTTGSYTVGWPGGHGIVSAARSVGKSFYAQHAIEALKTAQASLRGVGHTVDVYILDEAADMDLRRMEAQADIHKGMRELIDSLMKDPSPRPSSKSWGFKRKIINTSEKDEYKAKTRGQRFPGTGWGKRK